MNYAQPITQTFFGVFFLYNLKPVVLQIIFCNK